MIDRLEQIGSVLDEEELGERVTAAIAQLEDVAETLEGAGV